MADKSGSAGDLHVSIGVDIDRLKGGMKEAEQVTQKAAASINSSLNEVGTRTAQSFGTAADSARSLGSEIKDSVRPWQQLSSAIGATIGVISRFTFLVGAATAAVIGITKAVGTAWTWFVNVGQAAEAAANKMADPFAAALAEIEKATTNLNTAGIKKLTEDLAALQERLRKMTAEGKDLVVSFRGKTMYESEQIRIEIGEAAAGLKNAIETARAAQQAIRDEAEKKRDAELEDKSQQDILAAIRKSNADRLAEFKKLQDDMAAYQLETALMVLKRQKELDKERVDAQIKNFRALESAFESLVKSQRGVMDSNKLAIDINRLAAAVEDIARSPRGVSVMGQAW